MSSINDRKRAAERRHLASPFDHQRSVYCGESVIFFSCVDGRELPRFPQKEMSPLRGLALFRIAFFPNAHALGYGDIAAPRLDIRLKSDLPRLTGVGYIDYADRELTEPMRPAIPTAITTTGACFDSLDAARPSPAGATIGRRRSRRSRPARSPATAGTRCSAPEWSSACRSTLRTG
jgi:hypothetical protein